MKTVYLVDGNSYVYRAFYAIRGLTAPDGRPVNAAYGFVNMMLRLIREKSPAALVVAFDTPHPTGRHEMYEAYKATRQETPEDLISQMPLVKDILRAMNIPQVEAPGFEADDVLATLADEAVGMGMDACIVTGDKDMLQLVDDHTTVYDPMKEKTYDSRAVQERFGVPPARVVEYMALVGDTADNIPGVKGVGEKTAKGLLARFESLEALMSRADEIESPRMRKLISEGAENIELSRRLALIRRDAPVSMKAIGAVPGGQMPDLDALRAMFTSLGFRSLMKMLPESAPKERRKFEAVLDAGRLGEIAAKLGTMIAIDTETTSTDPMAADLVGFSLAAPGVSAVYVPLAHRALGTPAQMPKGAALELIRPVLCDPAVTKAGHNIKYDMLVLRAEGVDIRGTLLDTMVASHLLNPDRGGHGLEAVALEHLGHTKRPYSEVAGKDTFDMVELAQATDYAAEDSDLTLALCEVLFGRLRQEGLYETYERIEMPLIDVLSRMEEAGVALDSALLGRISREMEIEMAAIEQRVYFQAGEEFNMNSPKQLGHVLFDVLGLKPGKKKKTGYSTDSSVLEELSLTHPLPEEVLAWRTLAKLRGTYTDALPRRVNPRTGRLHTSFNQAVTATGRLSSSEPNLQNIPARGPWGRRIREAFVAPEGCVLLSADYSQIELRVLAHLCGDEGMIRAFADGLDIHTATASALFDTPAAKVTPDQRRAAKTVNFGVLYGMSAFRLAGSLGIPRAQAEDFIRQYFDRFPGVGLYIDRINEEARKHGYVTTMFGRKRPLHEINSKNKNARMQAERMALNTTIQGTAAEIIKLAMIDIARRLRKRGMATRMLLQVHDELLFEVPLKEKDSALDLVIQGMSGAVELITPLVVDAGTGQNWAEAH